MKKTIFAGGLAAIVSFFMITPGISGAQLGSPKPLTPVQEKAITDFALFMLDGPSVALKATLNPPTTSYIAVLDENYKKEFINRLEALRGVGFAPEWDFPAELDKYDVDISCGLWHEGGRSWTHPNGEGEGYCLHEEGTSHVGTIKITEGSFEVIVEDAVPLNQQSQQFFAAEWSYTCEYSGSESGRTDCEVELVNWEGMYGPGPETESGSSNGKLFGGIGVALALAGAGYYIFTMRSAKTKNVCEDEALREAAARARKEQAEKDFNDLDRAKKSAQEARAAADKAKADAERAHRAAGTRWSASGSTDWEGQHREISREGWHDKEAGKKADEAAQKAKEAEEKAKQAKDDFNAKGGDNAWSKARDEKNKADEDWRSAKEALDRCLNAASAPEPTPTPTPPVTSPPTTPTPSGPAGPTTSTPPPVPTSQPRNVCINGEKRPVETKTENIRLLDLDSVRVMQDRIYSDAGNEAMKFVDWLQNVKDTFMVGKRMTGGITAYFNKSLTGAGDAIDLPDFFTYFDKATDLLNKSMHELALIMQEKQQLGTYWLEYSQKNLILTCTKYDLCVNGAWERRCELTVTDNGIETHRIEGLDVHVISELQPVLRRLFNSLKSRFSTDKQKAERFTQMCH